MYKLPYKLLLLAALGAVACKKYDFGNLNTSPNPQVSSDASTAQLFSNVTRQIAGAAVPGVAASDLTVSDATPGLYVQYFTETQYPGASLYTLSRSDWSLYYSGPLKDAQEIIDINSGEKASTATAYGSAKNQIAIARIIKAFYFHVVTDRWGDAPYFDAFKGSANPTPKYDKQQDIYNDLFKELREAMAQFDGGAAVQGDLLFGGDAVKWKRFANSLRMRLAIRLTEADATKAKTEFLAAYNDAAGWIDDNGKNATFPFLDNRNFRNPWAAKIDQRDDLGMSNVFIDSLKSYSNDPRIAKYASPTPSGTYAGAPYGWNQGDINTWASGNQYSRIGTAITAQNAPGYLITASEMYLLKAEAALRGWIATTDFVTAYNKSIEQSWQQWGVYNAAAYTAYIAEPKVAVTAATDLETGKRKIGTQKWISLYPNGQEAWAEWRRLNYPRLTPARDAQSGRKIPLRNGYPGTEPTLNGANYNAQVASMPGGDSPDVPVWWDK